jgi:ketosteroid isomerase-like protein
MAALLLVFALIARLAGGDADARTGVGKTLDAWHAAAARADEGAYFAFFTPDAVFLGTDPTERWTRDEFRQWAHPRFATGKAWTMTSTRRWISLSADGKVAWFDEDVLSQGLGPVRGSGVLVRVGDTWKIAQYNLSVPIPNDRFDAVKRLIATQ